MIVNGWLDWATITPGIPDKVYSQPNSGMGLIGHSIVGTPAAALGRFLSTEKDASGNYTSYAAASVMFINPKAGPLIQMYPVTASTWTSGGREANTSLWAIETEGGAPGNESEPLNDNQVANLLRLVDDFEGHRGFKIHRGERGSSTDNKLDNFREHGEVAHQLGYSATACPSHRYDNFYEALWAKEEDMADPRVDEILKWITAETGDNAMARIAQWNSTGNSAQLGYQIEQDIQAVILADQPQETQDNAAAVKAGRIAKWSNRA